jgi:hypothetical protein
MPMQGQSNITTDHGEIRRWVEAHGGHPATVKRTARGGGPGLLRIDYPGFSGEDSLEEISWDEFFDKFEESGLAFVYQDRKADGSDSRFSKLVRRDGAAGGARARRGVGPRGSKSNPPKRARASSSKSGSERTASARAKRAPRAGTAKTAGRATATSEGRRTSRSSSSSKASAGRAQGGQRRSAKPGSTSRSSRSSSRSSARSRGT